MNSIVFFLTLNLYAQKSDVGNWMIYFGNQPFKERWNWWTEVQFRNYDLVGDVQQVLLRTGVGYNLTENNNNLLLGYGFTRSENYIDKEMKVSSSEYRVYQQFIHRHKVKNLELQHRFRMEERFFFE